MPGEKKKMCTISRQNVEHRSDCWVFQCFFKIHEMPEFTRKQYYSHILCLYGVPQWTCDSGWGKVFLYITPWTTGRGSEMKSVPWPRIVQTARYYCSYLLHQYIQLPFSVLHFDELVDVPLIGPIFPVSRQIHNLLRTQGGQYLLTPRKFKSFHRLYLLECVLAFSLYPVMTDNELKCFLDCVRKDLITRI